MSQESRQCPDRVGGPESGDWPVSRIALGCALRDGKTVESRLGGGLIRRDESRASPRDLVSVLGEWLRRQERKDRGIKMPCRAVRSGTKLEAGLLSAAKDFRIRMDSDRTQSNRG